MEIERDELIEVIVAALAAIELRQLQLENFRMKSLIHENGMAQSTKH